MTRRTLFAGMAATAALAANAKATSKIRLGGPVFGKIDDPRELARAHRALGYSAAYCPEVKIDDASRIRAIEDAFKAENVVISEVGAWVNLLDPDGDKRKKNFDYVASRFAIAEAVGAICCVDIAGSYNPTLWAFAVCLAGSAVLILRMGPYVYPVVRRKRAAPGPAAI